MLGPLANNGGLTLTHLPLAGSRVVDAVPVADCVDNNGVAITVDQRGTGRPQGLACDIGSVDVAADATPPVITPSLSPPANGAGWNNGPVTVTFTVTDAESTISSQTGCGAMTLSAETTAAGTTLTCSATSGGGTTSKSVTVRIDLTAPTGSFTRTPANGAGWNSTNVTVNFACSDGLSGPATAASNTVVASEGAGQSATSTCLDVAGNSSAVTASGINIDKTAPSITSSQTPAANGAGWNNADVVVSFTCSDSLSMIASCTSPQTVSAEGTGSVNGSAVDVAGNTASAVRTVRIDKTLPLLTAPPNVTVNATSPSGAVVTNATLGTAASTDALSGPPTVVRTGVPAANQFPIGTTTLTYTATDGAGNSIAKTQAVTVKDASGQLGDLTTVIGALPNPPQNSLLAPLNAASNEIANGNLTSACNQLSAFISSLNAKVPSQLTAAQAAQYTAAAAQIRAVLGCSP